MSDEDTESSPGKHERRRITPIDVQQQVFRRAAFRGYNEQEVDDFLDEVTEELQQFLEEQRELRQQLQTGVTQPVAGAEDIAEAKRMADDIVRRAREEAEEILRKARTEAAATSGGGTAGLRPFLTQERLFLQDLSKLIQSHADTVREMAGARRPPPEPATQQADVPPPPPAAAPAEPMSEPTRVPEAEEPADEAAMEELLSRED